MSFKFGFEGWSNSCGIFGFELTIFGFFAKENSIWIGILLPATEAWFSAWMWTSVKLKFLIKVF